MTTTSVNLYEDFCIKHDDFITAYKMLYDDVAVFSVLPEQFIDEADPVIQKFIESIADAENNPDDRARLQTITGFIERFYAFTDSATAMFSEHQMMADQTVLYLQDMMRLKKAGTFEQSFAMLVQPLEKLEIALISLEMKVDFLKTELEQLRPIWTQVVEQLQ